MQQSYEALNDARMWLLTVLRNFSKEDRMVCQSVWDLYFVCLVQQTKDMLEHTTQP